jgi:hypothetical protein
VDNLEEAHTVSRRIGEAIRAQVPHVERVRIHYKPQVRSHLRYAVPLADPAGTIGQHFGQAPHFALVTMRTADGHRPGSSTPQVERQEVLANPHANVKKAKGIRTGEWLVGLKAEVVLLRDEERVQGRGRPMFLPRPAWRHG